INHGQEIVPFAIRIAGPGKQVMSRTGWFLIRGLRAHKTHAQNEGKTEYETGHLISHPSKRKWICHREGYQFCARQKKRPARGRPADEEESSVAAKGVADRGPVAHNNVRRVFEVVFDRIHVHLRTNEQAATRVEFQPSAKLSQEVCAGGVVGATDSTAGDIVGIETGAFRSDASRQLSRHVGAKSRRVDAIEVPKNRAIGLREVIVRLPTSPGDFPANSEMLVEQKITAE